MRDTKIAVIGLGYVGLPLAVEFGKIYKTIGFDINPERILELEEGIDRTREVEISELHNSQNLSFVSDSEQLSDCNVFIITVPTPIDSAKRPNLEPLISASELVGQIMAKGSIVIYESTVYPGCTEEVCVPILEAVSGLSYNVDFSCGYSPERVNPGDKVNTLSTITKVVSGSNDTVAQIIDELYASIIDAGTFKASSIRVAEASKVMENTQRDLNIALANELSMICHRLKIDTIEVLEAAGSKWNFLPFRPGLVGGHCIGVDPYYLAHKATEVGFLPEIILGGRRINENYVNFIQEKFAFETIKRFSDLPLNSLNILVLGATFKENCPDTRNSKVLEIINGLTGIFSNVSVYDPYLENETKFLKKKELGKYHGILIAVGHEEFKTIPFDSLCISKQSYIMDLKKILNF